MSEPITDSSIVDRYLELGLRIGRHVDGYVDAFYGPRAIADRVEGEALSSPRFLAQNAAQLLADLDAGRDEELLNASRRRWLRAQVTGMRTWAQKMAGDEIGYVDEVSQCYGVRPTFRDESEFAEAHSRLNAVLPGSGAVRERVIEWREAQAIPVDRLPAVLNSLAEDFRERTQQLFGLPEGEHVSWELASNEPWSGFNYYEGNFQSRVAINTDLPVLATSIGHLVAHEAYPGHHTEHSRKEVGLVRTRGWQEESIFCVGTPQCLIAEGLADLALEIISGDNPDVVVAEHLRAQGINFEPEIATAVREASESMNAVRSNAAWLLHEDQSDVDLVISYIERWGLLPRVRAAKAIEFLTSPTWRAYISCYVEGLPLCRKWVNADSEKFMRLLTEQLIPSDLQIA